MPTLTLRVVCLFLVAAANLAFGAPSPSTGPVQALANHVRPRGSLDNSRLKFTTDHKGVVAFLGGSITEMEGYRPMVADRLRKRFPATDFTFINAGVSSTCSTTGAMRLDRDVLTTAAGPVDLLFVEFAVNDDQDANHTRAECIRGMEGIVRHAWCDNPDMDIVITYFVNEPMLQALQSGKEPLTMAAHEAVAEHYGVPTIHLAAEVADEITAGTLTWKQYGGVHPAAFGNAICARMIDELFNRAWAQPLAPGAKPKPHALPDKPLDPFSYEFGRFIDPKTAHIEDGWTLAVPDWKDVPGGKRARFTSIPMLCAAQPGSQLTLPFEGTAVGAYVVAGPDAGVVEARIDDGPFHPVDLYHHFSKGLNYPRTVLFGVDLPRRAHVLTLRISPETHSTGHAARIMQFVAN